MDQIATSTDTTRFSTDQEHLTYLVAGITEFVATYPDVVWMAQPAERAVYLHVTDATSFSATVLFITTFGKEMNGLLELSGLPGQYICDTDHDRHCIEIYHSHF